MMKTPDFFIVGAPKCGTTAMNFYLQQHPDIFMSKKEIHFFGRDLDFRDLRRVTRAEYLAFFSSARREKRVGEAAVWYLCSERAAAEIKEFCPSARIIIMLRNPVDVMYALYCQRLYNGNEDINDFEAALAVEQDRKRGMSLPRHPSNLMGCFYRNCVQFTKQVRRYLDIFGRENVHVIIFDDLQNDAARVYKHCCEFLDVDSHFQPSFPIINARQRVRSKAIRDLLHHPPPAFHPFARALMLRPNRQGGYKGWLKRLNTAHTVIPEMKRELRRRLHEEFLPEVEQLSSLLGRNLSSWCHR
jgi:hypothetical protein